MKLDACLFYNYCSLFFITTFILSSSETNGETAEDVAHLVDPCCYDKWTRPDPRHKTAVYVHMHVYSIGSIDAQNLQYTAHILLRYRWNDPRLKQDSFHKFGGLMMEKVWSPHLYIVNEYDSKLMGSFPKDITMSIWPDGTVVYLTRLMVTLRCMMDLQRFPFDSQRCPLIMESWSYNASHLSLMWEVNSPVTVDNHLQLPEYVLVDVEVNSSVVGRYQQTISSHMDEHITDQYGKVAKNFSTLSVHFTVKRQYGFYVMDYYVPSIFIVVVSWVTFWLDANSVPGRTVLGTSTFLTFITLSRNIGNSLPKVSYIKSSEIWFIGCTGFIFSSLAEFAFVNIIWRRKKNVDLKKVTGKHILQSALTPQMYHKHINVQSSKPTSAVSSISNSQQFEPFSDLRSNGRFETSLESICPNPFPSNESRDNTVSGSKVLEDKPNKNLFTMTPQEIANWIDRRSRIVFPIAFLIFNILYWTWTLVLL